MAKINRPNNIVTLGQTAPVGIGQGTVEQSLPVVIATDQPAIPVEEQNKVQSEVALSLLGIPRSEVALGIFADVNTYDVDPGEWTQLPVERKELSVTDEPYEYKDLALQTKLGHGLSHIPEEAGALLEAPRNDTAVLTSKRFFRYQPGRVSAATFGVKSSVSSTALDENIRNPAIRKYGIYDNFDGYYWETRDAGIGDQFCVARRTQALIKYRSNFGNGTGDQAEDYGIVGSQDSRSASLTTSGTVSSSPIKVLIASASDQAPVVGMKIYDTGTATFINPDTRITAVTANPDGDNSLEYQITLSNPISQTITSPATATFKADFSGDLAVIRDKLLLTHAAMYDPTLLKEKQTFTIQSCTDGSGGIVFIDDTDADQLEVGQMVMFESTVESSIVDNSIFIVKSITNTAGDAAGGDSPPNSKIVLFDISTNALAVITAANLSGTQALKTPVPFIFPKAPALGSGKGSGADIMFPYARNFGFDGTSNAKRVNLDVGASAGVVKTDTTGGFNASLDIKTQVDSVNNGTKCIDLGTLPAAYTKEIQNAWSNWIRHNVKSDFYGVYEYRVPRSRFSFDFLDGSSENTRVFSDATKVSASGQSTSQKLPGDPVIGDNSSHTSLFEIDFENVLMKKIEFSWYGAVGALFLVYVPVGNGEARWVRVHHLRASNQLKVASLGNATLPLTYTVYGGGTAKTLGRALSSSTAAYAGGKTASDFVVKYGSSYYIDGGDRGTVKLFNHSNDTLADLSSHVYRVQNFAYDSPPGGGNNAIDILYTDITNKSEDSPPGQITLGKVDDILINSRVITGNVNDNGLKVVFVERLNATTIRLHLNRQMAAADSPSSATALQFVTETGQSIFGLTSKTTITSSQGFDIRNRVQVYPTKLATAMTSPNPQGDAVKLELNKNVIFQENAIYNTNIANGTETMSATSSSLSVRTLSASGLATPLNSTNMSGNFNSLVTTDKLYGWFYVENINGGGERALFGFIRKISDGNFEFVPIDTYSDTLVFKAGIPYLFARQYAANGSQITSSPGADTTTSIDRLSSINIIEKQQRPIVGTGTTIATFFLEKGSEYFSLSPYFDYNKDYISFPLTDIPDNLFLNLKTDDTTWSGKVGASVTWEEQ